MFFKKPFAAYLQGISPADYKFIKKYSKRTGTLCGVTLEDITDLPWDVLKHEVPKLFETNQLENAIHLVLKHYKKNITFTKVRKAPNSKKLLFLLWLRDQYETINQVEKKYLYNPPEAKQLQAGIQQLDVLGDINGIDNLAQGDILKWELIRRMKYSDIFNKMLKNTIEVRINKRLIEINKEEQNRLKK